MIKKGITSLLQDLPVFRGATEWRRRALQAEAEAAILRRLLAESGIDAAPETPVGRGEPRSMREWLSGVVWSVRARIQISLERRESGVSASIRTGGVETQASTPGSSDSSPSLLAREHSSHVISSASVETASSAVVRFIDRHLLEAWQSGASDIHFEMRHQAINVKYRIDGVLVDSTVRGCEQPAIRATINRIKVLARLDIAESRVPQDGRFRVVLGGRGVDLRVSIMPTMFGEDAVIRLLDKAQLRSGDDRIELVRLGFDPETLGGLRSIASEPHGMLLVTGPTGSGKTTTLYALLSELDRGREKAISIEDPVEYELPGVLQIPVNEKRGLTFTRGLRSILRHDPDRILVGEIRDPETAEIAVQAALTGHLVLATVHANNAFDVIGRFVHMNVGMYGFVSALNGIVVQRLLRLNCSACSTPDNDAESAEALEAVGYDLLTIELRRGRGCAHCRGTGYVGRTAVGEVLPVDDLFRELVLGGATSGALRKHAAAMHVVPLRTAALRLLATGRTTRDEILRVVGSSD